MNRESLFLSTPSETHNLLLENMIEDILSGGNFGKKDKDRYHGSMLMSGEKTAV